MKFNKAIPGTVIKHDKGNLHLKVLGDGFFIMVLRDQKVFTGKIEPHTIDHLEFVESTREAFVEELNLSQDSEMKSFLLMIYDKFSKYLN